MNNLCSCTRNFASSFPLRHHLQGRNTFKALVEVRNCETSATRCRLEHRSRSGSRALKPAWSPVRSSFLSVSASIPTNYRRNYVSIPVSSKISLADAMPSTQAEIIAQLPARFEKAKEEGDLFFFPSTTHKHEAYGTEVCKSQCPCPLFGNSLLTKCPALQFEIRLCPALQNKPTLPTPHFDPAADENRAILEQGGKRQDPFAPPYVPNLLLGDVKDEEEGTEYIVLVSMLHLPSPNCC